LCGLFKKMFKKRLHISVPMIIHGFSKNEQTASNYWTMVFISFGKYLLRNQNSNCFKASLTIVFSWKRILLKKIYVYALAKYKVIWRKFKNK
jgi:hypothetical protein